MDGFCHKGSAFRNSSGNWNVPYGNWNDGKWNRNGNDVRNDWNDNKRVVLFDNNQNNTQNTPILGYFVYFLFFFSIHKAFSQLLP